MESGVLTVEVLEAREPNKNFEVLDGVRTIAPDENCSPPPVKVRVWVRVSVEITVGGNFPWGNCPRTALDGSIMA